MNKAGIWIIMVGLLILHSRSQAQTTYNLTVKEAVDIAYKNVIELKNAQLDYRIQESVNKETFGRALPQVSANIGAQYYLQLPQVLFRQSDENIYEVLRKQNLIAPNVNAPAPILVPFSFQQPWNLSTGITLQQLLFQPDVFVGLQARQTALNLSSAAIDQAREKIKDSAYKRYYAILIAQKQLFFLKEGVTRLEKLYHDDSVLYKNGFAEKLDLDKVQVQLSNLKTTTNIIESGVQLSYAALKFAMGVSQKDSVVLIEELTTQSIKENILDDNFKYEDRPEVRTLIQAQHLQELNVRRYQLGYLPTVSLAGNYSIVGQGKKFFTAPETRWLKSSYIGLNANISIFDGFQRKEKVKQAKYNVDKVANNISLVKQGIDFEQVITKETLKNSLLNLDAQEKNMRLAESVYNTTKKKFEQGLGSSFEVLQADNDWQTAQANYFNALYNATIARISYKYSLGKLE